MALIGLVVTQIRLVVTLFGSARVFGIPPYWYQLRELVIFGVQTIKRPERKWIRILVEYRIQCMAMCDSCVTALKVYCINI